MNTRRPKITSATAPPAALQPHELGNTDETIVVLRRTFDELGDLYRVHVPSRGGWTWVASHPDDVKRVLVTNHRNYTKGVGIDRIRLLLGNGIMTSEGEFWRRQRRMLQPAFHRRIVERYASIVREENESLGTQWSAAAHGTGSVNVTLAVSRLALRIILRALFGDDLRQLVPDLDDNPFVAILQDARRDTRFAYEFRQLAREVRGLVAERRVRPGRRFDLLQLLLDARDADTGEAMSDAEVVDEVMTLVVAGHETTASTLNWTWWLLATHPAVAARVAAEQRRRGRPGTRELRRPDPPAVHAASRGRIDAAVPARLAADPPQHRAGHARWARGAPGDGRLHQPVPRASASAPLEPSRDLRSGPFRPAAGRSPPRIRVHSVCGRAAPLHRAELLALRDPPALQFCGAPVSS